MRRQLMFGVIAIVVALYAVPLFLIIAPFCIFNVYVASFPVELAGHPHVHEILDSLRAVGVASFCLLPFAAILPFACISSGDGASAIEITLEDLTIAQRFYHDELIRLAPTPNHLAIIYCIGRAADLAVVFDDHTTPFQDGVRERGSFGDVQFLTEIGQVARSTIHALYSVLVHLELGVMRIAFVDSTVLAAMAAMHQLDVTRRLVDGRDFIRFDRIVRLSSGATASSVARIQQEVQSAVSMVSSLYGKLQELDEGDFRRRCHGLDAVDDDVCLELTPLMHGATALVSILSRLAELQEALEEGLDEWRLVVGDNPAPDGQYLVALTIFQTHFDVTEQQGLKVKGMRQYVEPALDFWKVKSRKPGQKSKVASTHLTLREFEDEASWEWHRQSRRNMGVTTVWYRTCGPFSIRCPPPALRPNIDDIFIHHNQALRYKMWVCDERLVWVALRTGDTQPSDPDRKLWIKKDGEPSWITKGSYSVYRSLLKKAELQEEEEEEEQLEPDL
ncbi:hypothetical protein C8Q76DRAFT_791299 [Earliella scabrosa]|nr:hypothetical protein C8Q76DRAFT_791299 [Earliella scabrosa]